MNIQKEDLLLYAVTDRSWLKGASLAGQVRKALEGGVTLLQLREKDMPYEELVALAGEIHEITLQYGIPMIINDSVEAALAVGAEGVHLGQEDMDIGNARARLGKDKIIGISAHTVEEALRAENYGADYIGTGALFTTSTKKDAHMVALRTLTKICDAVSIPVVAIGGITKDNILQLKETGITGVAVVSAIFAQQDIGTATRELKILAQKVIS